MQREFTDTLNNDHLFHLLLHSDISTVTSMRILTGQINWCDSDYFWKLKFGKDHLPILGPLPDNFAMWRKEYIRTMNASIKAVNLLENAKEHDILFNYNNQYFNFKNILPSNLRSTIYNYSSKHQIFNQLRIRFDHDKLKYIVRLITDQNHSVDVYITYENLYDILTIIFYHYRDIEY